ncbi:hypothetical protein I79_024055 [Cricetulus griseus]|uniref:Uncharacterized protein n=1 Tax=Cricetulus griseus TaxID=10029 RepID=G3IJL9_CRIGR|nr:hypothetical protein I79_024055 [Cricetulus griseus]
MERGVEQFSNENLFLAAFSFVFQNVLLELYKISITSLQLHAKLFPPSLSGDVQIWHGKAGV